MAIRQFGSRSVTLYFSSEVSSGSTAGGRGGSKNSVCGPKKQAVNVHWKNRRNQSIYTGTQTLNDSTCALKTCFQLSRDELSLKIRGQQLGGKSRQFLSRGHLAVMWKSSYHPRCQEGQLYISASVKVSFPPLISQFLNLIDSWELPSSTYSIDS